MSGAGLAGGSNTPTVSATTRRDYSSNIIFDPIDFRFLTIPSSASNIQITTNGIPSVCIGNCQYSFDLFT